jgi:hypothetical protein
MAALVVLAATIPASAQTSNKSVSVTGYGSTVNEAREDAIHQALQQTIIQLIVVDRVIKDDEIVRDKILSTMNGYIEDYKETRVSKKDGQVSVSANIVVSPSRIENFLGVSPAAASEGSFNGAGMFAEAARQQAQTAARAEIVQRSFRGFPADVLKIDILSIKPNKQDTQFADVAFKVAFDPLFVRSMKATLRTLSIAYLEMPANQFLSGKHALRSQGRDRIGDAQFCVVETTAATCYLLEPANYRDNLKLFGVGYGQMKATPELVFGLRFVDENGNSVGRDGSSRCILTQGNDRPAGLQVGYEGGIAADNSWVNADDWDLYVADRVLTTTLSVSLIDMPRARRVVAIAGLSVRLDNNQFMEFLDVNNLALMTDPQSPLLAPLDFCGDELDRRAHAG